MPSSATAVGAPTSNGGAAHAAEEVVPAVTRSVAILKLLAEKREPRSLGPIAEEVGIKPGTALHILRALTEEGLVRFDAGTGRYGLDVGVLALARGLIDQDGFGATARPVLEELSRRFGVTLAAMVADGRGEMLVVASACPDSSMRLDVAPGTRMHQLAGAMGRCVAAFGEWAPGELARHFGTLDWENPPPFATWMTEVESTRRAGHGIDRGNQIRGVTAVAAPVLDTLGRPRRGIVAAGLTEKLYGQPLLDLSAEVRIAAQALSTDRPSPGGRA